MWPITRKKSPPIPEPAIYDVAADVPAPPPMPATRFRPAPYALGESESRPKRLLFHLLAIAIAAAYAYFVISFWAPAPGRPGIDENAYLLGGRMVADHLSPSYNPPHPLSYIGSMWVLSAKSGLYYPKYPAGLPLLYAIPFWFTSADHARTAAFLLSPVCAILSAYVMFLLTRRVAGSFAGLLGMIVLATGITTLQYQQLPNSHLPCLLFVITGMYFLVRSVQTARTRWAVLAGFLLGYAVTIRYSTGLMVLPLLAGIVMNFRPRKTPAPNAASSKLRRRLTSLLALFAPLLAWAIPVGTLALFNWVTMGHLSGYGATNESTGFTVKEFFQKWEFAVAQIHNFGLFFIAPLGVVGLVLSFRRNWKVALLLSLWFVPGTLLYFSYYWGQNIPGVGFLRFFLDLFPALILSAFWLVRLAGRAATLDTPRRGSVAVPLAAGILAFVPAAISLRTALPEMARQHTGNLNLAYSGQRLRSHLPQGTRHMQPTRPVIFADEGMFPQLLMYLQFAVDADFYAADAFIPRFGGGFGFLGFKPHTKDDSPVLVQEERRLMMEKYYKARTARDLVREQQAVMSDALDHGRPVYLLLNTGQIADFKKTFITPPFQATEIDHWSEPAGNPADPPPDRPLSPPSWRMNLIIPWNPFPRHLLQVTRTPAATQPVATE